MVKNPPANAGDAGLIPGLGRSSGEVMATYSSNLTWEVPWTDVEGEEEWAVVPLTELGQTGGENSGKRTSRPLFYYKKC